jgi:hypothetical protein
VKTGTAYHWTGQRGREWAAVRSRLTLGLFLNVTVPTGLLNIRRSDWASTPTIQALLVIGPDLQQDGWLH